MFHKQNPRRAVFGKALALSLLATAIAGAASAAPPHDLYGDPAHADLAGMWTPNQPGSYVLTEAMASAVGIPAAAFQRMPHPPGPKLTPAYQAMFDKSSKAMMGGEPPADSVSQCLAFGLPRFMTMPIEMIQTPAQLTMNLGVLHDIRRIYLDGRGHTPDVDPSFSGDSVGHWEGDTLVVETIALRGGTFDRGGIPFSDKLTVVERIRRSDPGTLEVKMVLTDPEAFTEPFLFTRTYKQAPAGSRFEEYICENKDRSS